MMQIELLGHTMITTRATEILPLQEGVEDADHLAELTGRDCYQSFDRPNPATEKNADYIKKNLIDKQHFSVLEHGTATLRITGISRSLTHELIRHRHLSYSQLSQRYVDIDDADYVIPPMIRDWEDQDEKDVMLEALLDVWENSIEKYGIIEGIISGAKKGRKRAREASRAVMPNMTETIIDVTANHRAWREMISKRHSEFADLEIDEMAEECLSVLREIAPNTYKDL